jgi:RNA methyltransferase, TrmH family
LTTPALGTRHPRVRRLRALHRDRHARAAEQAFVLEGPRLVEAALDRDAPLEGVYLGYQARPAFGPLVERLDGRGIPVHDLREGVLEKVGSTRTPQPVLGVAPIRPGSLGALAARGDVVVAVSVADPGNLGTILRSAEAAGAVGVVVADESVDPYNPKVVRASAGAVLGVPIVEVTDAAGVLDGLRSSGRRSVGTAAHGGRPLDELDPATPVALVVGNEARGLDDALAASLDTVVTVPMHGAAESLNVAMAATVVLFDLDRRRAGHPVTDSGTSA